MAKARLLVVDDEGSLRRLYVRRLMKLSYEVHQADSGPAALTLLEGQEIDVLLTDFKMPGMDGVELITHAVELYPMLQCIVITAYADIKTTINAMGAGAFNYLQKPVNFAELDIIIEKGLEKQRMLKDLEKQRQQLDEYRRHLEELVLKRTLALTIANKALTSEIEERKGLEDSLRQAKTAAENANRAKSEFLANMSHEIRTPMTSAIGLLNLVLETELLPKQKAYLEMARISTVIMHNLLNDILDSSKIEAGRLSLESIAFSPRAVIDSVVDLQHLHAEEKAIRLSRLVAEEVPEVVVGDPNRLRQIILNLVSNAIKFTKYGEVAIECGLAAPDPAGQVREPGKIGLQFSVRDSGIGIEEEKLDMIFEAFTQADGTITRRYGGVGLGLNICSKLVALMGGRIWVDSRVRRGSTFHFTSVFTAGSAREQGKDAGRIKHAPDAAASRLNLPLSILVVEDDEMNQWLIQEILRQQGHDAVNAADGEAALREIENRVFDLVFLDLMLPKTNGLDIARTIRERERLAGAAPDRRLPIIAISGHATTESEQKCREAGMDDFLAKPFTIEEILAKVNGHAAGRAGRRPGSGEVKAAALKNIASLDSAVFDEAEALQKASGNQDAVRGHIRTFVRKALHGVNVLRGRAASPVNAVLLEQEVQNLKEEAMQAGAVKMADELFGLLLDLRNGQAITAVHAERLEMELKHFQNDPRVEAVLHTPC
jgi:signal transduction histidine kinase